MPTEFVKELDPPIHRRTPKWFTIHELYGDPIPKCTRCAVNLKPKGLSYHHDKWNCPHCNKDYSADIEKPQENK